MVIPLRPKHTQKLQCSSFLGMTVMTYFLLGDYKKLPKKELPLSPWVHHISGLRDPRPSCHRPGNAPAAAAPAPCGGTGASDPGRQARTRTDGRCYAYIRIHTAAQTYTCTYVRKQMHTYINVLYIYIHKYVDV